MEVLPENEKVIKLADDDEGWVDTHHGVAIEQISESVQEMKLDQSNNTPQMVLNTRNYVTKSARINHVSVNYI